MWTERQGNALFLNPPANLYDSFLTIILDQEYCREKIIKKKKKRKILFLIFIAAIILLYRPGIEISLYNCFEERENTHTHIIRFLTNNAVTITHTVLYFVCLAFYFLCARNLRVIFPSYILGEKRTRWLKIKEKKWLYIAISAVILMKRKKKRKGKK